MSSRDRIVFTYRKDSPISTKKAEIGGSSHLKFHRLMALSSANVSVWSTKTILKCQKVNRFSSKKGSCV